MKLVSIIMPVYNTGELLRHTIECIVQQSYQRWELLLIDDGSSDNISSGICEEYAKQDNRIRVFHKLNGGICQARNYGLERANGDVIAFCDHDDDYLPELLSTAVDMMEHSGVDMVKYGYITVSDDGHEYLRTFDNAILNVGKATPNKVLNLVNMGALSTVWSFLYSRKLLITSGVKFDERMTKGGEDFDFNFRLLYHACDIYLLSNVLYRHYIRESLSTSFKAHEERLPIFLSEIAKIENFLESYGIENVGKNSYRIAVTERIIGYVSYSIKLGHARTSIVNGLRSLKLKGVNAHMYDDSRRNRVNLKQWLVYQLMIRRKFCMIYSLYWVYKKGSQKIIVF